MHHLNLPWSTSIITFFANIIKTSWHVNFNHIFFAFAPPWKILPLLPSNFLYMTVASESEEYKENSWRWLVMKEWWFRLIFIMMIGICCITPLVCTMISTFRKLSRRKWKFLMLWNNMELQGVPTWIGYTNREVMWLDFWCHT